MKSAVMIMMVFVVLAGLTAATCNEEREVRVCLYSTFLFIILNIKKDKKTSKIDHV